ncbi:MAG: hypothetical protein ABFD60_07015 [Bryobacteraceae bacterium]
MKHLLKNLCDVKTLSVGAADEDGHPVESWATTSGVRCRVYSYGFGRETLEWKEALIGDYLFDFAPDQAITEQDKIVFEGDTFDVIMVRQCRGYNGAMHHKVALARLVR